MPSPQGSAELVLSLQGPGSHTAIRQAAGLYHLWVSAGTKGISGASPGQGRTGQEGTGQGMRPGSAPELPFASILQAGSWCWASPTHRAPAGQGVPPAPGGSALGCRNGWLEVT